MSGLSISEFIAGGAIALAASALTALATYAIERARWSREEQRRGRQERLRAYTRFLGAVYLASTERVETPGPISPAMQDAANSRAELEMLSPDPVRKAAAELTQILLTK